jgi:hypothetical protein
MFDLSKIYFVIMMLGIFVFLSRLIILLLPASLPESGEAPENIFEPIYFGIASAVFGLSGKEMLKIEKITIAQNLSISFFIFLVILLFSYFFLRKIFSKTVIKPSDQKIVPLPEKGTRAETHTIVTAKGETGIIKIVKDSKIFLFEAKSGDDHDIAAAMPVEVTGNINGEVLVVKGVTPSVN